ncbi:MAG: CoA-binding protein [Candidatus Latescibacteria bacterium]|nr:CoA-binding protein [Candidatus Latescibacterota bacterium]
MLIADFLAGRRFAVVGASRNRAKFGNKVLRCYMRHGLTVYPVNPQAGQIEGLEAYPALADLPEPVERISVVTPPAITAGVVEEAAAAGVAQVWMQPGAESAAALRRANELGLAVIAGGPCLLVELGNA